MTASRIILDRNPANYAAEEMITGRVEWNLDKAPSDAQLRLFWYTEGKGDSDVVMVVKQALPAATDLQHAFSIPAPIHPPSYQGRLLSVLWSLEVVGLPRTSLPQPQVLVIGPQAQALQAGQ